MLKCQWFKAQAWWDLENTQAAEEMMDWLAGGAWIRFL